MAVSISIQTTTVTPSTNGYVVQLYISDKPAADESPAMRVVLTATVPPSRRKSLAAFQHEALGLVYDALHEMMQNIYAEMQLSY